ncbi:MAG: ABC transporter substrate-binding protein [Defluviitaleaceae bacterium]|nr:ABC transporter substrate-binding protein [Defluviitaleaceae bacterium]
MELGFFYEEGLDIQLITSDGADRVMTALLSGSAQIGLSGPEATIYVYSQGREDFAIVFAGLTARDGSFLLGRQDDFIWDDLKGSYILPGRRGGMPFMVLEYVLTNKGLREYVYFNSTVQFAAMVSTFLGGTGDFVTAFEPIASTLELEGRGYVLKSVGEYAGELPYTTYYALSSFIEENTEIIEAFTRAVARGQRWVYENEAEDIADVISPFFPETDSEILASAIGRYKQIEAFALTPIITEEAFYRMQRIMDNAGELPQWIDFETLVNNDFSRKIIEN